MAGTSTGAEAPLNLYNLSETNIASQRNENNQTVSDSLQQMNFFGQNIQDQERF